MGKNNSICRDREGVIATYYLETDRDLKDVARHMAMEETIGGQMEIEKMSPLLKKCYGEVISVQEYAKGKGVVKILLPIINMDIVHAPFAHMWMYLAGGPAFELTSYHKIRLLDFNPPKKMLKYFPGPRLGLAGFRKYLGLKEGELLLGTIVKPCCGLSAQEVADLVFEAARGGVDLIKDDEKMNNVDYCPLKERVKLVQKRLEQVYAETGKKPLYATNITTKTSRLLDNAKVAIDNGANALMVNIFAVGFDGLAELAEWPDNSLPIYCHSGTRSAWSRVPNQGIDLAVVAKLARYLGADFFRTGITGGYCVGTPEQFSRANNVLTEQVSDMKDTLITLSGGLHPGNLGANLSQTGWDVVYMGGSSIVGHPLGIRAGVKAFRQAAEAYQRGISAMEYARKYEELEKAVEKWGVVNN